MKDDLARLRNNIARRRQLHERMKEIQTDEPRELTPAEHQEFIRLAAEFNKLEERAARYKRRLRATSDHDR